MSFIWRLFEMVPSETTTRSHCLFTVVCTVGRTWITSMCIDSKW